MQPTRLRDTDYARELGRAVFPLTETEEARMERLYVHGTQQEEVRFSWWRNGSMANRPPDLSEEHWLRLLELGIRAGLLSDDFRTRLREML